MLLYLLFLCLVSIQGYSVVMLFPKTLNIPKMNHIVRSNFNGSNTFGTMTICSRQGQIKPMWVDYRARSRSIICSSLIFLKIKLCCVELPHQGNSYESTEQTFSRLETLNHLCYINICSYRKKKSKDSRTSSK